MSYTLFISDLHLEPAEPKITQAFLRFLEEHQGSVDALYILGDLFESWVGDDDDLPYYQEMRNALRRFANSGSQLWLMHGNRDFLLGQAFADSVGGILITQDTHMINLYGQSILLLHGDTLCTDDTAYLQFRQWVRDPNFVADFLKRSLIERRLLAQQLREKSQEALQGKSYEIMDANSQAIENTFEQFQVALMVHGHTHRPAVHEYSHQSQLRRRFVLGSWEHDPKFLKVMPEKFELVEVVK